jgi:predicted nucleic-acid-binding protein
VRAVDTNVLVRYLVADDATQFRHARRVMESGPIFVAKSVLLEMEWVLRRAFAMKRAQLSVVLRGLSGAAEVELEDRVAVLRAVEWFEAGMDFADALHVASKAPGADFVTFDRGLAAASRKAGVKGVVRIG